MCPACIASAATLAVSVTSGGGVVALVLTKVRRITGSRRRSPETKIKEKQS
jgi:hypothetical protein